MPLEELKQAQELLRQQAQQTGQVPEVPKAPPTSPTMMPPEPEGKINKALGNINLGIAYTLGLPRMAIDAINAVGGFDEDSPIRKLTTKVPSTATIQEFMEDAGIPVAEEGPEDTVSDRFLQNVGMLVLPGGIARKSFQLGTELAAAGGAAIGGKLAEESAVAEKHPVLARVIGELSGGLGAAGVTRTAKTAIQAGGGVGTTARKVKDIYKGPGAQTRAARALDRLVPAPEATRRQVADLAETDIGQTLSPGQRAGERGLARMQKTLEIEDPRFAEQAEIQRATASQELRRMVPEGDLNDFRNMLEMEFNTAANDALQALDNIIPTRTESDVFSTLKNRVTSAYKTARDKENQVWEALPSGESIPPSKTMAAFQEEFRNMTEGGDINEIVPFIRKKLGKVNKKGELTGGQLVNKKKKTPSAKALHQFYSVLGRQARELSDRSGQTNKIRIINRLRQAVLDDLDEGLVGGPYREAIQFSKDLNRKFTDGEVGRMLGLSRGDTPTESRILDNIMTGTVSQSATEAIQQVERAAPEAVQDIKDFLKIKFLQAAEGKNGRINTRSGEKILGKMAPALKAFPGLREELLQATVAQRMVDDFAGIPDISDISPLAKEKSAAGIFLNADPGNEMSQIILDKNKRTKYLTDLVQKAKKDRSGKSVAGMKNAVASELIKFAEMPRFEDVITGEMYVSGTKFLKKLRGLKYSLLQSGLMSEKEYDRLKQLGRAFRGIEYELTAEPLKEGAITDLPSKLIEIPARYAATKTASRIAGRGAGAGVGLQTAQMASSVAKENIRSIFQDNAKQILMKAFQDDAQLDSLFKNISDLSKKEQDNLLKRLGKWGFKTAKETTKPPMGATLPAAATIERGPQEETTRPAQPSASVEGRDISQLKEAINELRTQMQ